jgi:hypothetical protein
MNLNSGLFLGRRIRDDGKSEVGQLVPLGCLLAIFTLLNLCLLQPVQLSVRDYQQPVIFLAAAQRLLRPSWQSVIVLGICLYLLLHVRSLRMRWTELDRGGSLRVIVGVCAFLLGWIYSTYDYNHFLGRTHGADRVVLALLFLAVLWRPAFVFPFLCVLWPIVGQFNVPIGGYSWAIAYLPTRILLLFGTMLLLGFATKKWETSHFIFLLLCLIAGHYFPAGLGKLKIGWWLHDRIYYLLPNTYANGWLGFMKPESIDALTTAVAYVNGPLKALTIVAECGALFFLVRHTASCFFLGLWSLFHLGIFFMSGICFWPWIVIDATLLLLVWKSDILAQQPLKGIQALVSIVLIAASPYWVRGVDLSWIDSPATYTYRVTAVGVSGQEYTIPPSMLAPFDYQFTLGGFHYLSREPTLPVTWGATDLPTFQRLRDVASVEQLIDAEGELGTTTFDQTRTDRLRRFITTYFRSLNDRRATTVMPRFLRAPRILWAFPGGTLYDAEEDVVSVQITQVFTGRVRGKYQEVRSRPVLTVDVAAN